MNNLNTLEPTEEPEFTLTPEAQAQLESWKNSFASKIERLLAWNLRKLQKREGTPQDVDIAAKQALDWLRYQARAGQRDYAPKPG